MTKEYLGIIAFCLTLSLLIIFSPNYKLVYKINKKC